jgi:hypothetical protein
MTDLDWPAKNEEWRGDGFVVYHDKKYRIHKAWTDRPHVFVCYTQRGRLTERKLSRFSDISQRVIDRFRTEVRREQSH